ncbi:MAG: hypothetical protein IPP07_08365 [Holophagales bacterium]|nr:hypothetical protein [Holophagales bacterium]
MHDLVPGARPSPWSPEITAEAPLYARFDTGWYRDIARDGYGPPPPPGREAEHAFFPLYPFLARAIHLATGLGVSGASSSSPGCVSPRPAALPGGRPASRRAGRAVAGAPRPSSTRPPSSSRSHTATPSSFSRLSSRSARSAREASRVPSSSDSWPDSAGRPGPRSVAALAVAWWLEENGPAVRWRLRTLAPAALLGVALPFSRVLAYVFGIGYAKGEPGLFFASWPPGPRG